jgi:hypothetical protein
MFVSQIAGNSGSSVITKLNIPADIVALDDAAANIEVPTLKDFMKSFSSKNHESFEPRPVDILQKVAAILFSSGTTGNGYLRFFFHFLI